MAVGNLHSRNIPSNPNNNINNIRNNHKRRARTLLAILEDIVRQLNSNEAITVIREIIGNTQVSKTELENLIPIRLMLVPLL